MVWSDATSQDNLLMAEHSGGALGVVRGDWQYIPAMIVLTIAMALWRGYRIAAR